MIESVRFESIPPQRDGRSELLATASVSFRVGPIGRFVVHGVKIVRTTEGRYIISMPSGKRYHPCPSCNRGTPVVSRFCCNCGKSMGESDESRPNHADNFHPLDQRSRMNFEAAVLEAFFKEAGNSV